MYRRTGVKLERLGSLATAIKLQKPIFFSALAIPTSPPVRL